MFNSSVRAGAMLAQVCLPVRESYTGIKKKTWSLKLRLIVLADLDW